MIIDAHAHYTSAPAELQAYRGRQIMNLRNPARPRLQVSDEQLERSMRNQFKRMQDTGIDRLLFSPQASAMGHHFGSELVSRYWTEACNDLNAAMHTTISYYIAQHHSGAVELLSSRVFQDFPTLKLIIPHGGGAIPYQWNRHRGMHVREGHEPFEEAARRVYWDMAIYVKEAMDLLIKRMGVDNTLLGTRLFGS